MKMISLFIAVAAIFFTQAGANAATENLTIINESGYRLDVYVLGRKMIAQVPPHSSKRLRLPIRTQSGVTYDLMVVGGGSWQADSSGWTTRRNIKTCAVHNFSSGATNHKWTITGRAMKCNGPVGYRQ